MKSLFICSDGSILSFFTVLKFLLWIRLKIVSVFLGHSVAIIKILVTILVFKFTWEIFVFSKLEMIGQNC